MRIFKNSTVKRHNPMNFTGKFRGDFPSLLGLGFLAIALMGCGAPRPIKYYQLTYPSVAASQQAPINASLLVTAFGASHLYRDERIVYSTSPNELGLYELQRWVLPPVDLLRDAMVRGLTSAGHFRSVMTVRGEGGGDFGLNGHIYEFGEVDGSDIVARLHFVVRLRNRKTGMIVWTHTYSHDEPAGAKTVSAVVAAMDKNVQRSVEEIQAGLDEYFRVNPPK
jgi:ABC-type uncharacterized transport system auxiliary subunit